MPCNTTSYSIGDVAQLTFTVADDAGTATNTAVKVVVKPPTGPVYVGYGTSTGGTPSTGMSNLGAGYWRCDYPITMAGRHAYSFTSSGVVTATTSGAFAVRHTEATT